MDNSMARPFRLLVVLASTVALLGPGVAGLDRGFAPADPRVGAAGLSQVAPAPVNPGQVLTTSTGDSPVAGDVLQIPAIDLEASLVNVALGSSGVLSPPSDTDMVGRWNDSASVGAMNGQSVLTGHTVSSGDGVMNRLGELVIGDRIRATDDGMAVDYVVTSVEKYSRSEIAEYSQTLFGQDRPANRLVLVTCADFSADGIYLSNIVVLAYPVRRV
ncbi:hypothetical protein GCM10027020_16290 [Nocardioides salsibiostraticola]